MHCLRPRDIDGLAMMASTELADKAVAYANRNAGRPDVDPPA